MYYYAEDKYIFVTGHLKNHLNNGFLLKTSNTNIDI